MSKRILKFEFSFNEYSNPTTVIIYVSEGKIVKVYEEIYHDLHGRYYSTKYYTPEDELYKGQFDNYVLQYITEMLKNSKSKYKKLVKSLNKEMLNKYFEKTYIPIPKDKISKR